MTATATTNARAPLALMNIFATVDSPPFGPLNHTPRLASGACDEADPETTAPDGSTRSVREGFTAEFWVERRLERH
jgi:hypothetical protein